MTQDPAAQPTDDQAGERDRHDRPHAEHLVHEPRTLLRGVRRVADGHGHGVSRLLGHGVLLLCLRLGRWRRCVRLGRARLVVTHGNSVAALPVPDL
jgi:hypothetical protein